MPELGETHQLAAYHEYCHTSLWGKLLLSLNALGKDNEKLPGPFLGTAIGFSSLGISFYSCLLS